MTITCTFEESRMIRKGLKHFIKAKKSQIKNVSKHLGEEPDNEEATAIRQKMIERRTDDIIRAQALLDDLDHIAGVEAKVDVDTSELIPVLLERKVELSYDEAPAQDEQ